MNSDTDFIPQMTPQWVTRALGKNIPQLKATDEGFFPLHDASPELQPFTRVTTDSREVIAGSFFIALQGESTDGHLYLKEVIQKKARAVLVKKGTEIPYSPETLVFEVEDTQKALRQLSYAWRREFSIPVIAVAGSVGKTRRKKF
jgi:UDP-N-acetylmuramyl pentapeptide synthase